MTDEPDIIDGAAIYQHTKKLYTEKEFRQRYQRLDYVTLTAKQQEIFDDTHKFLSVRAGNRSGKSEIACVISACALLDRWPKNYRGYKFVRPNIARSVTFNEWLIGPTGVAVRDIQQAKMLGGLSQQELGTGWLPLSCLRHPIILSRGTSGLADKVLITRDDESLAALTFKTHEMGQNAFAGDACDLVVLDEDPGKAGEFIWPELTARIVGTGGRIIHTATPLAGLSPIRKFFKEPNHPERGEIRMSIYDNTFLTKEDIATAESSYTEREKMCRLRGDDLPGYGAVINFVEETYLHDKKPSDIPTWWNWINGIDFSHHGLSISAHSWAFVSCAVDPTTGQVFVMHAIKIKQELPPAHVAAAKRWPMWDAVTSWGADGHQRNSDGSTFASAYKALGLNMRGTHATLRDGGVGLEPTIAIIEQMLSQGQLKIARHLTELRDELRDLAYDANNKFIAENDDGFAALRYAIMDLRYAKPLAPNRGTHGGFLASQQQAPIASDVYYDESWASGL